MPRGIYCTSVCWIIFVFIGWALTFFKHFLPRSEDYTCHQHHYQSVTMVNLLLFIVFVVLFLFFLIAHYIFCYFYICYSMMFFYQSSIPFLKREFFNLFNRMSNRIFTKSDNFYCIWYLSISISVICNISFRRHCYITYSFVLF